MFWSLERDRYIDGVSIGAPISKSFDNWFGAIEKKRVGEIA